MENIKLPKVVRFWFEQFQREGESQRAALYHAIDRAASNGEISDKVADKLEKMLAQVSA